MSGLSLVSRVKLTADGQTEQRILDYLNENASAVLAEKINAGKKTLAGAVKYATDEARKLSKGGGCVCVDDATVFGWIVHFFEEDEIQEPKKQTRGTVRTPGGVKARGQKKEKAEKPAKPAAPEKPKGPIFMELFSAEEMGVKS
jgi:hypothetical protein